MAQNIYISMVKIKYTEIKRQKTMEYKENLSGAQNCFYCKNALYDLLAFNRRYSFMCKFGILLLFTFVDNLYKVLRLD